jgi:hypothetical protein
MDTFTKGVMTIIAIALCAIALRLWFPPYATLGDMIEAREAATGDDKGKAVFAQRKRLLGVQIVGGSLGVDVTGMPTVDVNAQ